MPESGAVAQVRGLGIVMLRVSDLDRSVAFYQRMLGFVDGEQMLSPGRTLTAGDCTIYLTEGYARRGDSAGVSTEIALGVIMRGVREAFERLQNAGVEIVETLDAPNEFFASFAIADPDGLMISVMGPP